MSNRLDFGMSVKSLFRWRIVGALVVLTAALGSCRDGPTLPRPNEPPVVGFLSPTLPLLFAGGDTLEIAISAFDPEQGALNAGALSWWAELHHDAHTHPLAPVSTGATGRLGISRLGHAEPTIFIRLYARAVDETGAADTVSLDVSPRLTSISLSSVPAGLRATLDGQPRTLPYSELSVVGMLRSVSGIDPLEIGGTSYSWRAWADGGALEREVILTDAPIALTALYDSIGPANAAPSVSITAPVDGSTVTEGTAVPVTAAATDPEGDAVFVSFLADDVVVAADSAPPFSTSLEGLARGRHRLTARAEDARGARRTSTAVELDVLAADGSDVLAPDVALTAPAADSWELTGALTISATATDNVAVTAVELAFDDSVVATLGAPPYETTLPNVTAFTRGVHSAAARARDAAGNWSPWTRRQISVGGATTLEPGFTSTTVATGLVGSPTALAFGFGGRLYVTEQGGTMRVWRDGALLPEPFVTLPVADDGEQGLLGVAIDPDYATTRWIYLFYTSREGGGLARNRLVRVTADASHDRMQPGSLVVLAELPPMSDETQKHNGGAMHFGPDGKLYLATGDLTLFTIAQALDNPFGKILRFNRNGTIPADNPFYDQTTGINRAIWARGFRNPFTFTIDRESGRMHINDVGQGTWEEVNLGRAGANYGWPNTEGPTNAAPFDGPFFAYHHDNIGPFFGGTAVIGGAFYPTGGGFGARFAGDYFFADYALGWIARLDARGEWAPSTFAQLGTTITGMTVGPDGALYVLAGTTIRRIAR